MAENCSYLQVELKRWPIFFSKKLCQAESTAEDRWLLLGKRGLTKKKYLDFFFVTYGWRRLRSLATRALCVDIADISSIYHSNDSLVRLRPSD